MDGSGTRHRSPDASRLGTRSRCLACSTERVRRRIYLLRRANLTMTGVRAGPSQRAIRLIASSSSPNRPLQVDDMSVPQTANYNVAVSSRLVGATLVGHVTLMGSTCPAACAARQRQGGPRGGPAHLPQQCSLVTSLDTIVTRWCRVNLCVPCWGRAIGRVCVDGIASRVGSRSLRVPERALRRPSAHT